MYRIDITDIGMANIHCISEQLVFEFGYQGTFYIDWLRPPKVKIYLEVERLKNLPRRGKLEGKWEGIRYTIF